jgi:hypothetical protein
MKAIFTAACTAVVLALAAPSFAHAMPSFSRVPADMQPRQMADAGYRGRGDEKRNPNDAEAAQQRADRRTDEPRAPAGLDDFGAEPGTTSESGSRQPTGTASLYFGS